MQNKFCPNPQAVEFLVFSESFQGIVLLMRMLYLELYLYVFLPCICIRNRNQQIVWLLVMVISRWFKGNVFLIRELLCRCYRSLQLALPGFPRFWAKSSPPPRPLSAPFFFVPQSQSSTVKPLNCHSHVFVLVMFVFVPQSANRNVCFSTIFSKTLFPGPNQPTANMKSTTYENDICGSLVAKYNDSKKTFAIARQRF